MFTKCRAIVNQLTPVFIPIFHAGFTGTVGMTYSNSELNQYLFVQYKGSSKLIRLFSCTSIFQEKLF